MFRSIFIATPFIFIHKRDIIIMVLVWRPSDTVKELGLCVADATLSFIRGSCFLCASLMIVMSLLIRAPEMRERADARRVITWPKDAEKCAKKCFSRRKKEHHSC